MNSKIKLAAKAALASAIVAYSVHASAVAVCNGDPWVTSSGWNMGVDFHCNGAYGRVTGRTAGNKLVDIELKTGSTTGCASGWDVKGYGMTSPTGNLISGCEGADGTANDGTSTEVGGGGQCAGAGAILIEMVCQ
jgi:hypothetical protein